MATESEIDQLRAERDLYRQLLDLGAHDDLTPFLDDALGLIVGITGAQKGYLALYARRAPVVDAGQTPHLSISRGCSEHDVGAIRAQLSSGIIAQALETGRTISTASAAEDPRFKGLQSVQARRIQAVLCAPIGGREALGVLYLQGRTETGPFSEGDRTMAETFAVRIAPFAEKLLHQDVASRSLDYTADLRGRLRVESLAGTSRALAETFKQIAVAAPVDVTVLITGESGTGKTEIARALHASSRRSAGPFVEINCGALPEALIEAELFGAEKGAHSTATRRIPGKIAAAEHGTLFLDEIAEIPIASQAKLLQFLQARKYFRLGSETALVADVRIIAATNADLEQSVREKRFREDLFYRINVLTVRAPALRDRSEDIPALAEHLARAASVSFGKLMMLSWEARVALTHTEWPGNVRQLASAIQRGAAFALDEKSESIEVRHLFPNAPVEAPAAPLGYQEATRRFQKRFLQDALDACQGNVSEVARRMGLARSHLHELLRGHGIGRTRTP